MPASSRTRNGPLVVTIRPTRHSLPIAACLLPLLCGCVETGDFGRVKQHSTWNEIVEGTGAIAARARQEPVSAYAYTDEERVLRDRAWRFLVPAHERAYFDRALAELAAKRVLPPLLGATDPTTYQRALLSGGAASPASRYRRLGEDAAADARLLPALAEAASRVAVADGVRLKTLDYARDVSASDVANATARVAENRCLLLWVRTALAHRIEGYRFALEHLVIETPQADAVPAERSLAQLSRSQAILDGLPATEPVPAACTDLLGAEPPGGPAPLVLKG